MGGKETVEQQVQAIVNKLIIQWEAKGAARTAFEETNLAVHAASPPLRAESLQTFRTHTFPAAQFVNAVLDERRRLCDPKCKRRKRQTISLTACKKATANESHDYLYPVFYAHRPCTKDFALLSPWEFMQWYSITPASRCNRTASTTTAADPHDQHASSDMADSNDTRFLPVSIVIEDDPDLSQAYVLKKRYCPLMQIASGFDLVHEKQTAEERSMIFNICLRPWYFHHKGEDIGVPHVNSLDVWGMRRLQNKGTGSWRAAWKFYCRGNIVTESARRLIRRILLTSSCAPKTVEVDDEGPAPSHKIAALAGIATVSLTVAEVRHELHRGMQRDNNNSKAINNAMQGVEDMWGHTLALYAQRAPNDKLKSSHPKAYTELVRNAGNLHAQRIGKHTTSSRAKLKPVQQWRQEQRISKFPPDERQWEIINAVIQRCEVEADRCTSRRTVRDRAIPNIMLVHGFPGSGRSRIIHALHSYWQEVRGWGEGVEYFTTAPMNSMAFLVGGSTLHTFAGFGIDLGVGKQPGGKCNREKRPNVLYEKLKDGKWLIIDEIENASAEVLAAVYEQMRDAARSAKDGFARRPDGTHRMHGGFNVIKFGDWWQVPPVQQTFLASRLSACTSARAAEVMQSLWHCKHLDALTHFYSLRTSHRSKDEFFICLLEECRRGELSWDMYNFLLGFSTQAVGSWLPPRGDRPAEVRCKNPQCALLMNEGWRKMYNSGASWADMQNLECELCAKERSRRCRLDAAFPERKTSTHFACAPYLHPYNKPKYHAAVLRCVQFATHHNRLLLWAPAVDVPVTDESAYRSADSIEAAKRSWIMYADTATGHIPGLLPLVRGLPMRFTLTMDSEKGLCKHTSCVLKDWLLHPHDQISLQQSSGAEIVLSRVPEALLVTIRRDPDTPPIDAVVKPVTKIWQRDSEASVRRYGFPLLPNFGGTFHSYTGTTLDAAVVDLLPLTKTARGDDVPAAYVGLSRVRNVDDLIIAQAFNPLLFQQGPMIGPHIFYAYSRRSWPRKTLKMSGTDC